MYGYYDAAVIGLRDEMFQDDSFGIRVARRLKELHIEPIDVIEATECELADYLDRYRTAIIVYSFHDSKNGEIIEMELEARQERTTSLPRSGAKLPEALLRGQGKASRLPEVIKVYCLPQAGVLKMGVPATQKGIRVRAVVNRILQALGIVERVKG
jgi:Ni,Fe-hydrogenase maturation factor